MAGLFISGCHFGGPVIPGIGWTSQIVSADVIEPQDTSVSSIRSSADINNIASYRLQIIICYGSLMSDHSALRLLCTDHEPVFWDPAGSYRISDKDVKRSNDLIVEKQPTIETYWLWRKKACNNIGMEVFEWVINANDAANLRSILLNGRDSDYPGGEFITNTPSLFCAKAVSKFLKRFGTASGPAIEQTSFIPHSLAKQLWRQEPNVVYVFSKDEPLRKYTTD